MTDPKSTRQRAREMLAERDPSAKRPSRRLAMIASLCDELDAAEAKRRDLEAERDRLREHIRTADSLLFVARRAASKLVTMYMRGECSPRAELDELLANESPMSDWIQAARAALKGKP